MKSSIVLTDRGLAFRITDPEATALRMKSLKRTAEVERSIIYKKGDNQNVTAQNLK